MDQEPDIYRTARLLIREHGSGAAAQAARNIHTTMARRDLAGQRTWRWVLRAIDQLQAKRPAEGAAIN